MKQTETEFDLPAWRQRLGITQARAAPLLGLSLSAYRVQEYTFAKTGKTRTTYKLLATCIEKGCRSWAMRGEK